MHLVDYHTHTALCGHATGTIDEYIARAVEIGLREIGFSDHSPVPSPYQEGITMKPGETEQYINMIETAKQGTESVKIKIGFEVDYPLFDTFDVKYMSDPRIDYLIGSCHFLGDWLFDHPDYIDEYSRRDIDDVYREYYATLALLASSGLFNIVGHFDLVKKFGFRSRTSMAGPVEAVATAMADNGMAVEINTSGLNKPVMEMYPAEEVLRIMFRRNVPVTLGSDSHTPDSVGANFDKAVSLLKKTGYRKISGFTKRKRYDITI